MELFSNPTIIGAIIGALVGAIASATFAIIYEHVRFNKKKKGAYALIQSEINYMNDSLKDFWNKYLKERNNEGENTIQLIKFYSNLSNFPIWTNINWISQITFIPSIFEDEEINKINQFYTKYKELSNVAKSLVNEEPPNMEGYIKGEIETNELESSFRTAKKHWNNFRKDSIELIHLGEDIKKIFNQKAMI